MPAPDLNRSSNVLECLCAAVIKGRVNTIAQIFMHADRHADAAWCGDLLQTGGDIDAITKDVVPLDDDVADVDADAEGDAPILGQLGGAASHRHLDLDRTAHRIHHARELQEQPVAGGLDDPPSMAG